MAQSAGASRSDATEENPRLRALRAHFGRYFRRYAGLGVTVVAIAFLLWRTLDPVAFVRLDEMALALLFIAALPWLAEFVEEISGFGVKAKLHRKIDVLEGEIQTMKGRVEDEQLRAGAEVSADESEMPGPASGAGEPEAVAAARPEPARPPASGAGDEEETDPFAELRSLAESYVRTRKKMPGGPARTREMTAIFHSMRDAARRIGDRPDGLRDGLLSGDPGENLAAIARAYTFPGSARVSDLITCVENARQPFVGYWGLVAIRRVLLDVGVWAFSPRDVERLRSLEFGFAPQTDRAHVLRQINAGLRARMG